MKNFNLPLFVLCYCEYNHQNILLIRAFNLLFINNISFHSHISLILISICSCVNVKEYQIPDIDKFSCSKCVPQSGPTICKLSVKFNHAILKWLTSCIC